jgi:CRISPR system Cascade subunit CasB
MESINIDIIRNVQAKIRKVYASKAALAKLRRGVGKEVGEIPELLEFTLPFNPLMDNKRYEGMVEQAMYTTLTLYALHQQGIVGHCVSTGLEQEDKTTNNNSFGRAVRILVNCDIDREMAITRRFDKVLTSKDISEFAVHMRGLIGLLKKADITMDYPSLATDLYWFQQAEFRRNVILQWGRDYYMQTGKEE